MPWPSRRFFVASELATAPGNAILHFGQCVDEEVGRRAGADADDGIRHDMGDGSAGNGFLS